jgi:hypothetical protein
MTTRGRILLEIAQYLAITAGILVATSGRFKLLAATVPLLLLGPFWLVALVRARRKRASHEARP